MTDSIAGGRHRLNILVLEPFGGGSHASLYRGWRRYSRHAFTILDLPAVHWKWRSRHSCLTLAEAANQLHAQGSRFDVVFCSEMLSLAEWRGFTVEPLRKLPAVAYFHENQFTYPLADGQQRDYHFAYGNILTAIAANQIWFNSDFHRKEFSRAASNWLRRMPDHRHVVNLRAALANSKVMPPGIDPPSDVSGDHRNPSPVNRSAETSDNKSVDQVNGLHLPNRTPTLGWVSRWEHDKRPDRLLAAVRWLSEHDVDFSLILLGQQFSRQPDSLLELKKLAGSKIQHCGHVPAIQDYWAMLRNIDVVVSTADHEFFGIAILEALHAGARPLLPKRLSYPELLRRAGIPEADQAMFVYSTESEFHCKLRDSLAKFTNTESANFSSNVNVTPYIWQRLAVEYDHAIEALVDNLATD